MGGCYIRECHKGTREREREKGRGGEKLMEEGTHEVLSKFKKNGKKDVWKEKKRSKRGVEKTKQGKEKSGRFFIF